MNTTEIGITIDPVALITQECITVTSAMRKHARWSQSSVSAILGGSSAIRSAQDFRTGSTAAAGGGALLSRPGTGATRDKASSSESARMVTPDGKGRVGSTPSAIVGATGSDGEDDGTLASRWGLRGKKGKSVQDNPLLSAFARLRRDLAGCKDISTVDVPTLLHPFLQVIRSSSTSAAITSLAVISITKFFQYNIITVNSPRVGLGMHLLCAAITHCRFEASDTSADEVVLLRILRLMESIMTRPEGRLLPDESICDMMSTGLSMCCQARLSEVLRRSAEMAMVTMCQIVFGRLKELEVLPLKLSGARSRSNTIKSERLGTMNDDLKIAPPLSGSVMGTVDSERPSLENGSKDSLDGQATSTLPVTRPKPGTVPTDLIATDNSAKDNLESQTQAQHASETRLDDNEQEDDEDIQPYALVSIRELFRVLIDLLDPHNKNHTDTMRIMALRIIDVALEVAGPSIAAQPNLGVLVENDLCRHLFQLVRSENMFLLNSSLRVAGTLLTTCRKLLKLQQELFLSYLVACLHPRVEIPQESGIDPSLYDGVPQAPKLVKPSPSQPSSGRATPVPIKERQKLGLEGSTRRPEAREAMVESIGTLIRIPHFMVQLFVNYDCEVDRQDLCEDMVGLLSRNAFPDAAAWSTVNVPPLCLDSLLSFVQFMAERADKPQPEDVKLRIERLQEQRTRKTIIRAGAAKFNDDPKAGIVYLVKMGVITNPDDPRSVAQFLRGTSHISKAVLGDFITKKSNEKLLISFLSLFDFNGKRIDEALRELLGSFRLPGESALIERLVTAFVEKYCGSQVPEGIANNDAGFVLTYAIIMLNTDLYNPNVKKTQKRMTCEDFARNLRGVNNKQDFSPELLQDIYDAISADEIILPEEHENKHAFDHAWKELLMKTHDAGDLDLCLTNAYDAEMFRATWKPIIATLCYVFLSASDDAVFSRIVVGFDQCAQLAARYQVPEAFDRIVYSLSQISSLAAEVPPSTSLNTEVSVGKRKVMVSELAVRLGRDFKAQLATVLLFRILNANQEGVGDTWLYIVRILRNLFVNSLISAPTFESKVSDLGPIPLQPPSQVIDRDSKLSEAGLFSSFTSYLSSYAADDPPEPSEEELENTLSSVDCVTACRCEDFLATAFKLPVFQIKALVEAILSQLPDGPQPVVSVKPERPMPVTARVNGHRGKSGLDYQPGSVFLLELATVLTLRDADTIEAVGESITNILLNTVRDVSNIHALAASRVVRYLLEILQAGYNHDFMRAPVVLHAISSFDDPVMDATASSIMHGLQNCIAEPTALRSEILASPDFWSIIQRLHQHKTEAPIIFEMLNSIAKTTQPASVTADSYESTVSLINDFASAGSVGSITEQRRDQALRRGQKPKSQTPTPASPDTVEVVQRALKAVDLIYSMTARIPTLISQSHLERSEAWAAYWSPIFRSLSAQCVNPCREIRHRALSALQRTLLSDELAGRSQTQNHKEWTAIFHEVLFPYIMRLLKPEIYQLDPMGMSETRVQAATLLCKIFLRYLDHLTSLANTEMLAVWMKVLELLDRMMGAGVGTKEGEALEEAVREGVKNLLLVMAGSGHLLTPVQMKSLEGEERKEKVELWNETGKRVEHMLAGLMAELFKKDEAKSPTSTSAAAPATDEKKAAAAVAAAELPPQSNAAAHNVETTKDTAQEKVETQDEAPATSAE